MCYLYDVFLCKTGNTPLHLAVMLGEKDCVQFLLDHGAKVGIKNLQGWTPLAEAVSNGNREISESSDPCRLMQL
jgi:ankyrin repeat protein